MYIIGVDYHPSFQQIAFLDQETGECGERRLDHSDGEAEKFYRELRQKGINVRVGLEDSLYIGKGELAKSNAQQVAKIKRILDEFDIAVMTSSEACQRLGLAKARN